MQVVKGLGSSNSDGKGSDIPHCRAAGLKLGEATQVSSQG